MLVQCPKCRTTFKVSADIVKDSAAAFRCSRCKHTFELEAVAHPDSGEPSKEPETHTIETVPEPELTFSFAASPPTAGADVKADIDNSPAADDTVKSSDQNVNVIAGERQSKQALPVIEPDANTPRRKADELKIKKTLPAISKSAPADYSKEQESDGIGNILPMASYADQRASIFPYMTLFGLLAIAFGLVAVLSQAHPTVSASIIRSIPVVGPMLLKNNHLKEGILIRSLRSSYQSIQGNREVFVVTGVALNQNPVVIREVQITGKVFNDTGKELEQQTIWVGNTISPKIIRGMTSEDIPHLQNLKPLKSFEIPPGDSVPFTIVFLRSAKAGKDFTCQVVTAADEV